MGISDTTTWITVQAEVHAPLEKTWAYWTTPEHIKQWNNASEDWHTPAATLELKEGGRFSYRMEAKSGEMGFDFNGVFTTVISHAVIDYTMEDGRKAHIQFSANGGDTRIIESFEAETVHSPELQQQGWQAILNNFKQYTETH